MRKAIFLDKDGTIIPDIPYNVDPSLITLNTGVGEGLAVLQALGYELIIVSNQSGVAFGRFEENDLESVFSKILDLLEPWNVLIKSFYYCPHHPDGIKKKHSFNCNCRKPLPGLINRAANDFNFNLSKSWMIGDILNDVEAGKKANCKSILIDNGNETEWIMNEWRKPDFIATNFITAAKHIEDVTKNQNNINAKQMAKM
jgi:D-glycero-D-manno-heptose 1,7-bisphosphate phosphatase